MWMLSMLGLATAQAATAKQGFGENVDAYCSALGRGTPYASLAGQGFLSECSLCHQFTYPPELPDKGNRFDPPAAEYLAGRSSGDFSYFCPGATNQPPSIVPIADRSVNAGQMLVIDVSASDADGDQTCPPVMRTVIRSCCRRRMGRRALPSSIMAMARPPSPGRLA
jgi:hypothetical protein